jgi:hypothetical protein
MARKSKITETFHPDYLSSVSNWEKYRATFVGGKDFVNKYLKKFSHREEATDFVTRRDISYCPAHAKAAIIDIKNSIYQRLVEIQRIGGSSSYQKAVYGDTGGVDRAGMTMTTFIGTQVLPELLPMAKVGIFVDKASDIGTTKLQSKQFSPYLYYYPAEDIQSWTYVDNILVAVLLKDYIDVVDPVTHLVKGREIKYRHIILEENGVSLTIYNSKGEQEGEALKIDLPRIPLVIATLSQSLLTDVSDYQIALLNLESSDIGYSLKSNFPFYTEQFNPQMENFAKLQLSDTEEGVPARETADAQGRSDIKIGVTHGRKYAKGLERPDFINPSPEPLLASMKKSDQLKEDIRKLVNLSLKNLERPAGSQSADLTDEKGLEAGLSYIGMELERVEREIAEIWTMYESGKSAAVIKYPKKYSLRSDAERLDEIKKLKELKTVVPSITFQKEIDRQIAITALETKVRQETMEVIYEEILTAQVTTMDHEIIREDHKEGLVSDATASEALGYPKGEAEKAKKDHADRAARIAKAQSAVSNRGVRDLQNLNDDEIDKLNKDRRGASNDDD